MHKIESAYPAGYAKTNVDLIVRNLHNNSCLTILCPSGFGKSYLLRFLANNRKYRRRYASIRNTEFVYIDSHDITLEKDNISSQNWVPNNAREIDAIGKVFFNAIIGKVNELEKSKAIYPDDMYSKDNLMKALEYLLYKISRRKVYFIIDGIHNLFTFNQEILGDFLQHLRDKHRGKLEYIFAVDGPQEFMKLKGGGFSYLIHQQIVILKLCDIKEMYIFDSEGFTKILDELVTVRTPGFKSRMRRINELSGGYPPYWKFLRTLKDLYGRLTLSEELRSYSKRLLDSLTPQQVSVLKKVNANIGFNRDSDVDYLLQTGLLKFHNRRFSLFSPIMSAYLKTI